MGKDFWVIINNPERAKEFQEVFGRTQVNVKSPLPTFAKLPGKGVCKIYQLDIDLLLPEERARLAAHLAKKFDLPLEFTKTELARVGMPILAEECTVFVENPLVWFV
ncbi:MAG: hypothetical protein OIN66_11660 [Candidatus Methanoperedens sp.]|nr:hypothetical protein [Candidatus Methanoperedens sp.]